MNRRGLDGPRLSGRVPNRRPFAARPVLHGATAGPRGVTGIFTGPSVDMACNPDRCAIAYVASATAGVVVRRLDPLDGTVLDATAITIQARNHQRAAQ